MPLFGAFWCHGLFVHRFGGGLMWVMVFTYIEWSWLIFHLGVITFFNNTCF